jgi:transposase
MLPECGLIGPSERDLQVFADMVPADHYLRLVQAAVDFEACRARLATVYHPTLGRPALDPVFMLKLMFLGFHYGLSDRQIMATAQVNVAFRYFLGISLKSPLPHHTSPTYFRERLGVEVHQGVFTEIVAQARRHGLVKDRWRLKDATHVIANIAVPSTIWLVAEARDQLLQALRPYAAERVATEEARAEQIRLCTADLKDEERLLERVTHLRALLNWVDLWREEGPPAADAAVTAAWRLAHKVLNDRDDPEAGDKVISVHDPDARCGKHGDYYDGYLLDVTADADSEIITAVNVLPANGDEAMDAGTLIRQEEQAQGNDVAGLSMDGIGFRGELLQELTDPAGLNLEVIVPPSPVEATTTFAPEQFALNADGTELTCPGERTSTDRIRNPRDTGWQFRFAAAGCTACPLRGQCLRHPSRNTGRTVAKSDYEAEYRAARAKAQTPEYAATRRVHPRIERKLADLVRWHGARRARYRGRVKVLVQMLLTAVAVNVKRVVHLLTPASAVGGRVRAALAVTG